MSKKTEFIKYVESLIEATNIYPIDVSEDADAYWTAFKTTEETEKPQFTDNGKLVLQYMRDNLSTTMWKAKDIGEGLFISSRTVSGAMRKLVSDGFVEKIGQDPTIYSLTENGKNIEII